ncbi:MAG TPA: EutN/CcmL family microcompartment protein [Phycisphaerae bacterium]|nr:EutN/CcmL family microcompartment protein [Phycisphaerae bacterium]
MVLAKVVGTVVATRKEASLEGLRFMLCRPVNENGEATGGYVVAADAVGSGVGEMVLYATGSSARQTVQTNNRPCDAVIMAIVDNWELDGKFKYKKGEHD